MGILERSLGVVGQRTPRGLQYSEFKQGLDQYRKASGEREKHETVKERNEEMAISSVSP